MGTKQLELPGSRSLLETIRCNVSLPPSPCQALTVDRDRELVQEVTITAGAGTDAPGRTAPAGAIQRRAPRLHRFHSEQRPG